MSSLPDKRKRAPEPVEAFTQKTYARVYNWRTGKSVEIGGTEEQVEKDLKDMKRKGIIDEDCEISRYKVDIPVRP